MDTDGGRGGGGTDRISGLPDDLLHAILLRLHCVKSAARTSVLSRRWSRVWTNLPELYLWSLRPILPFSSISIVDSALAACSAPTLRRLVIQVDDVNLLRDGVTVAHAAPWLRFASERVAGELFLWLPEVQRGKEEQDLDLPVCAATERIEIRLRRNFRLLPPPAAAAGVFAGLTRLGIYTGVMDGGELGALVSSSRCPRLEELSLTVRVAPGSDVSIRSDSLKRLSFKVENTRRLAVAAPWLLKICVSKAMEAHIAAPRLADVEFTDNNGRYEIAEAGRHIQRLVIDLRFTPVPAIMRRFDTIGELIVDVLSIPEGGEGYKMFTKNLSRLDCEALVVRSMWTYHGFAPSMLHVLRICAGLKKFVVTLSSCVSSGCPSNCPCTWLENFRTDNFMLDSLEEIKIYGFIGTGHQLECVNLLLRCNVPLLKRVVFCLSSSDFRRCTNIIQDKIKIGRILPPDIEFWATVEPWDTGILEVLSVYA